MDKIKKVGLIVFTILASLSGYTQDISGKWNGILEVRGNQVRLVFNIIQSGNGYSSTMDSPDQGAKGIPVSSTNYDNTVLDLELSDAGITYKGTLNKENVFEGTFNQRGRSFLLNLTKQKIEKQIVVRPQEPTKPLHYYSEDVKFENKKDDIVLAGTLTLPEKEGHFPVVILITGSGPQNRDSEMVGHKPFLVLSDHLTKNGIAVLRFDDRGTSESTGTFKGSTSLDFAKDVEAAVKYLKSRKEINSNLIGLVGHSEGGIIAPMVAARSKDVNFIVSLAGTGISGDQLLLLQQELVGKASGMSDEELQKDKRITKGGFDIVRKSTDTDSLRMELISYINQVFNDDPESELPEGMTQDDYANLYVKQLTGNWMTHFIKYNPALILEQVNCPVLAINGSKDLQVPAKVNLTAIKKALEKGGNNNVTTKEIPNLNHLFQECETGSPREYGKIEQTLSPLALDEITNWILKQVK